MFLKNNIVPFRKEKIESGSLYHVYNRGNNKDKVFFEEDNYLYFHRLLHKYSQEYRIKVHVYCYMPNHYHLLVRIGDDNKLSDMMRKWILAYTKAINKRYNRVGHLFQDRYKIKKVDSIEYYLQLSRYIHINTFFASLVSSINVWKHSSYCKYISDEIDKVISTDFLLSHFKDKNAYREFVETYAREKFEEKSKNIWRGT